MRITFISDTHNKHKKVTPDLPGGDLIIHSGDISSMGHKHEIQEFCKWFNKLDNYTTKIFIAGNHDFGFQDRVEESKEIVLFYNNINYLQDSLINVGDLKIWGSPWQPEFQNWAFNLPKNGIELQDKWSQIPDELDILITHGPPFGILDKVSGKYDSLGCELLKTKVLESKTKIHCFGHIHSGRGYYFNGMTHFINASVLDESYQYTQKPLTVEWDPLSNNLEFSE